MMKANAIGHELLVAQARALFDGEHNAVANAANLVALIFDAWADVSWAGIYFVRGEELVLGPFQGKVACVRIGYGAGVCGKAWARDETLIVPDVHKFPGHIACDAAANSEIVVPLRSSGRVIGVLDLDSTSFDRFDESDRHALEELAEVYGSSLEHT